MSTPVGFVALARTTFDVPFAEASARKAHSTISDSSDLDVMGSPKLATTLDEVREACASLQVADLAGLVVFQATFADSTLVAEVADRATAPLVLWATSEERTGDRLRLNSFCGINLAAFVLARGGVDYRWVYLEPDHPEAAAEISRAVTEPPSPTRAHPPRSDGSSGISLTGKTVGLVGTRPDGFEPCDYDARTLESVFGVTVDQIPISSWFEEASRVPPERVKSVRSRLEASMVGIEDVDQDSLDRSLQLYGGLSELASTRDWSGVATRCWPECFTEFGGAACAGNSMLTSSGTPGCCEADVYGNVTALLLQEVANAPALVADMIDLDRGSNTAVFWHCGLAPQEMAATKPRATLHSNRRMPLLNEFALREGRITICRTSQSRGQVSLVVGGGQMLDAPLPFSGTSGVARLDSPAEEVLDTVMGEGLEHHYGIVYGDHRETLHDYAADVGIPVIEL